MTALPIPCPPWCDSQQCRELHPADRYHQTGVIVPVVWRAKHSSGTVAAMSGELGLSLFTSAATLDELWVGIDQGEDGPGFSISVESAHHLVRELDRLLADASGGSTRRG